MQNLDIQKSNLSISLPVLAGIVVFIISTTFTITLAWGKVQQNSVEYEGTKKEVTEMHEAIIKISQVLERLEIDQNRIQTDVNQQRSDLSILKNELSITNTYITDIRAGRK